MEINWGAREHLDAARSTPFDRTEQLAEVLVFLFLIVPSLVLSLFVVQQGNVSFTLVAWSSILRDLALVSLVLFLLWRNGEPLYRLGWTLKNGWSDVILGVVLFPAFAYGMALLERGFQAAGLSVPRASAPSFLTPHGTPELVLAGFLVVVVAIAEETIFRGYLLLRLTAVTRSAAWAVLLSSAIFAIGHGYEGTAGVATVGVMGVVFALVYRWRGSLVMPMVLHFLQDFVAIVLVSALR